MDKTAPPQGKECLSLEALVQDYLSPEKLPTSRPNCNIPGSLWLLYF